MLRDRGESSAATTGYRFCVEHLRCPPAFPRTVSTLLIRPDVRRAVLSAAAQGDWPLAYIELVGLISRPQPGHLSLYLRRANALQRDVWLGELGFSSPAGQRRRSRQLRLEPDALAMIMASSAGEVLGAWRPRGLDSEPIGPLCCLDMRLLLAWPTVEGRFEGHV